ncbi:hypothetical protein G7Y89_g4141 [Cudoniella acicularis]|uniref:Uncharacterized protein n=1 Tax=Cudoniella acicularis TaxID=354080 RepID=A0A8H4RQ15_9HELO|nr:hypothetical protein G7Y89_g4141 [Cudoniella acicularis]
MKHQRRDAATAAENRDMFTFDDTGDVRILVTCDGQRVVGRASSQSLRRASPVWAKFLFPPFARIPASGGDDEEEDSEDEGDKDENEGTGEELDQQQNDNDRVLSEELELNDLTFSLDFTQDDSESVRILLNIVHLEFSDVPEKLNYEVLVNVAILCDQYDCVKVTAPWLVRWLSDEGTASLEDGHEEWLFISWVFGRKRVFERLAKKLMREVKTNYEGGDCILTNNTILPHDIRPVGIVESIMQTRKRCVEALLTPFYDELDRYMDGEMLGVIKCDYGNKACDSIIAGSLLIGLQAARLWPPRHFDQIHESTNYLASELRKIEIHTYFPKPGTLEGFTEDHTKCCKGVEPRKWEGDEDGFEEPPLPIIQLHPTPIYFERDDDGDALRILLAIAHLQFNHVPQHALRFEMLLNLAVLCEKYNCFGIVTPFFQNGFRKRNMTRSKVVGRNGSLLLSYKFKCLETPYMPLFILESIKKTPQAAVKAILDIFYNYVDVFENGVGVHRCQMKHDAQACDSIIYGSLIMGLQKLHLWPRKRPEEVQISIDDLAYTLKKIQISRYPKHPCVPNIAKEINDVLAAIPNPILDFHHYHFALAKSFLEADCNEDV